MSIQIKSNSNITLVDGDICFDKDTCKYSIYYKGKYYPIPEEAVKLSNLIRNKHERNVSKGIWR